MATGSAGIDVKTELFPKVSLIINVSFRGTPHLVRDILHFFPVQHRVNRLNPGRALKSRMSNHPTRSANSHQWGIGNSCDLSPL